MKIPAQFGELKPRRVIAVWLIVDAAAALVLELALGKKTFMPQFPKSDLEPAGAGYGSSSIATIK